LALYQRTKRFIHITKLIKPLKTIDKMRNINTSSSSSIENYHIILMSPLS